MAVVHFAESAPYKQVLDDGTEVIRTNAWSPPGCHPTGCGLRLFVKDGKLVKVEGDPDNPITHGKLCVRCLALKDYVYHPDRILYPMKRAREDRGKDKWERITWDEAFEIASTKIKEISEKWGPESIFLNVGTGREGVSYQYYLTGMAIGTPNSCYSQSGWSCMGPRNTNCKLLMGTGYIEYDYAGGLPGRYDDPDFVLPKYVLFWGKEPLKSNPDGLWGHAIIELMKRGTEVVMVDPRTPWLASRAKYVLHLRPGTDTALAFALVNTIIKEDLYDHEFVEKWVHGWDEFVERVMPHDAEWAAPITGVSADQIKEVARYLATEKPGGLSMGLATDQNPNGVQLVQLLVALTSITGNLDVPGGTVIGEGYSQVDMTQSTKSLSKELAAKCIGQDEYPALAMLLNTTHPDLTLDTLETGKPYPLKMCWFDSCNIIAPTNSAQPRRWYDQLRKLEFNMASDLFMNPTIMGLADLVLPISTFAEHDGVVMTHYGAQMGVIGAINKAIEVGECKSDLEILIEWGKKLNPEAFADKTWENVESYLDNFLAGYGMKFDDLRHEGSGLVDVGYHKYETGELRPDGQPGFPTTTGKLELYSLMYAALGEDPLPYYEEPRFGPIRRPDLAEEYPLTLTTGQRHYTSFHSEHRQLAVLREIKPYPLIEIHPDTAKKYGIQDGDWVKIENPWGSATEKAKIVETIRPDVVAADHGWWYPEDEADSPSLFGVWKSNVNTMVPHKEIGKLGFGAYYKSIPCKISRAESL